MNISERKNTRKGQARMTLHGMASLGLAWLGVNINHKKRRRRCSIDHIGFGLDGIDSSHPFFLCSYSELDMGWSLDKRLRADSSDERDRLRWRLIKASAADPSFVTGNAGNRGLCTRSEEGDAVTLPPPEEVRCGGVKAGFARVSAARTGDCVALGHRSLIFISGSGSPRFRPCCCCCNAVDGGSTLKLSRGGICGNPPAPAALGPLGRSFLKGKHVS